MSKVRDSLTEKQRRFVEAYMGAAAGNASEAARRAGYKGSADTLGQVGSSNIRKPQIAAAIAARTKRDPLIAKRKDLQRFWTEVANDERIEMQHRLRATELLAKSRGEFISRNKVDVKGDMTVKRTAAEMTDDELAAIASRARNPR